MKKIFMLLFIVLTGKIFAQQSFSTSFLGDVKKTGNWKKEYNAELSNRTGMSNEDKERLKARLKKANALGLPIFGIQGIGNINQEALESLSMHRVRFHFLCKTSSMEKQCFNDNSILQQKCQ